MIINHDMRHRLERMDKTKSIIATTKRIGISILVVMAFAFVNQLAAGEQLMQSVVGVTSDNLMSDEMVAYFEAGYAKGETLTEFDME